MANPTNILIGVGGTGAKVVEAATIVLASGIGPRSMHIGLVDQDSANGNVARTRKLITDYSRFRDVWGSGTINKIDWSRPDNDPQRAPDFGSIRISTLFDAPEPDALWCPAKAEGTLKSIIGENLSDDHEALFDMLFMPNEHEQHLPLAIGYQGKAHVGSAALVAALLDAENRLVKRLLALMEGSIDAGANIFLVGSAFGGTGAAGFPILARALNRLRNDGKFKNKGNISIGGLLMLPYFKFPGPDDEESSTVVTADELMPKAQLALEYYQNLFAQEAIFERFYVAGWDSLFDLKQHAPGKQAQTNPALLPELVAATAVMDFFARHQSSGPNDDDQNQPKVPVMTSSRQQPVIKWRDMPTPGMRDKLGQMLRFAVYWRYHAEELLSERRLMGLAKNWTQKLSAPATVEESEDHLEALRILIDDILAWAATLEVTGEDNWAGGPWSLTALKDNSHTPTPGEPIRLRDRIGDEQTVLNAFDRLIKIDSGDPDPRQGAYVLAQLVRAEATPGEHRGIGRAIAATYAAASLT